MAIEKSFLLARHYLFRGVDPATMSRVGEMAVTKRLDRGERLFQKGDEGDALFGVLEGQVRISAPSLSGKEMILNLMEEGDIFGEIALLDGGDRTADATAMTRCELLMLRRRDFMQFLEREPKLAIHLLKLLCERVRWTSNLIEDAAFLPLPNRLAKRLLAIADIHGDERDDGSVRITSKISQSELGQMMGTARETVNRHLQAWRRQGWVDMEKNHIVILDRDALEAQVEAIEDGGQDW